MATTYTTLAKCLIECMLASTDSRYDTELNDYRDGYYAYMNSKFRRYADAIPIPDADGNDFDLLTEIETLFVAAQFYHIHADAPSGGEEHKGDVLWKKAKMLLNEYIDDHFLSGVDRSEHMDHHYSKMSWQTSDTIQRNFEEDS